MKDPQARKWQITINNPQDKQLDHDKIKLCLGQLKSTVYYCMAVPLSLAPELFTSTFPYPGVGKFMRLASFILLINTVRERQVALS